MGAPLTPDGHDDGRRQAPVSRVSGRGDRSRVGRGRRHEQLGQRAAAALELARPLGLLAREALGGLGRELVDVGEDRLGEQHERLGRQTRLQAQSGQPPPGHAGTGPVGRQQRVQRAAGTDLSPPEVQRDGATADRAPAGQLHELGQRALHASPHRARATLQRPRVRRDLRSDRVHDLLGQRRKMGSEHVDLAGQVGKL